MTTSMIYVYKLWDYHGGYWTVDTPEKREQIDDSDDWYWTTEYDSDNDELYYDDDD